MATDETGQSGRQEEPPPSRLRQAGKWYLTALLIFVLLAMGLVIYLARVRPQEFFYVWF